MNFSKFQQCDLAAEDRFEALHEQHLALLGEVKGIKQ